MLSRRRPFFFGCLITWTFAFYTKRSPGFGKIAGAFQTLSHGVKAMALSNGKIPISTSVEIPGNTVIDFEFIVTSEKIVAYNP